MLKNMKSVQMADFFTMLFSEKAVDTKCVDKDKIRAEISALEKELADLESYAEDASYNEIAENRRDINDCERRIRELYELLSAKSDKKHEKMTEVVTEYRKTLADAEFDAKNNKIARLKTRQQNIKEQFERANLVGMTDSDAVKCRKLASIHQQITNAIRQNSR